MSAQNKLALMSQKDNYFNYFEVAELNRRDRRSLAKKTRSMKQR
jgi:hypothetical protein